MHTYGDACEMTEMTNTPLSGVGGGGAYIDRTVDKVSFVIEGFEFDMENSVQSFCSITRLATLKHSSA